MRLRTILFIALMLVSTIPVVILAAWQQHQSLNSEVQSVKEKHLLLAGNITAALDRYVNDAQIAFATVSNQMAHRVDVSDASDLLATLGFRHVCVMNAKGVIQRLQCVLSCPTAEQFSTVLLSALDKNIPYATKNPGDVVISDLVRNPKGLPSFYMLRANHNGDITIGELNTDYPKKVQKRISFGRKGHAAIVDNTGRLIAHPLPDWVSGMKNISKLSVVQKMMNGETGVIQFYSPAIKAEMVAGFNVVSTTGWGVMIPQPFQELIDKSSELTLTILGIAVLGIVIAAAISWWLSGMLALPLRKMADTATLVAQGNMSVRVGDSPSYLPKETVELTQAINTMLEAVNSANEDLKLTSEQARIANRAKSDFLSAMSHELRTPMNAILGFNRLLETDPETALSDTQERCVSHIKKSGEHLLALIEQVLDMNHLEMGQKPGSLGPVSPSVIIPVCVSVLASRAEENRITITFENVGTEKMVIWADQLRLSQILINLLSNAVKYNRVGGSIRISSEATPEGMLRIAIADTGYGIPKDRIQDLFSPFERLGRETGETEGSGLGLAICKELVELMEGNIGYESQEGTGSTFWLELPLSSENAEDPAELETSSSDIKPPIKNDRNILVLYVEDNRANIEFLEMALSRIPGIEIKSARTAESGLESARMCKPDIILMDINLPNMNGFEALEIIKDDAELRRIPVIALTSNAKSGNAEDGFNAGFEAYLTKPINLDRLYEIIEIVSENTNV